MASFSAEMCPERATKANLRKLYGEAKAKLSEFSVLISGMTNVCEETTALYEQQKIKVEALSQHLEAMNSQIEDKATIISEKVIAEMMSSAEEIKSAATTSIGLAKNGMMVDMSTFVDEKYLPSVAEKVIVDTMALERERDRNCHIVKNESKLAFYKEAVVKDLSDLSRYLEDASLIKQACENEIAMIDTKAAEDKAAKKAKAAEESQMKNKQIAEAKSRLRQHEAWCLDLQDKIGFFKAATPEAETTDSRGGETAVGNGVDLGSDLQAELA